MSEQKKDDKNKSNSGSYLTAGDKLYLSAQIPMAFLGAGMVSDAMQNHLSPDVPASVVIAHADNELAKLKAKDMSPEDYYKKSQEIKDGLVEQVSDNIPILNNFHTY